LSVFKIKVSKNSDGVVMGNTAQIPIKTVVASKLTFLRSYSIAICFNYLV